MSLETNFKQYKRFLETIDIAKYTVICKESRFRVAAYNKLGSTKGYLVLREDGDVASRDEAIPPYRMFMAFNSYMFALHEQGQAESNKPTAIFKDTINLLNEIKPFVTTSKDDIEIAINNIQELDDGYKRIKEIQPEAMKIFNEMMKEGILDQTVLDNITSLMKEFTRLQYKHLYIQIKAKEQFVRVSTELSTVLNTLSGDERKTASKAEDVFKFLTEEKYQSGLRKSLIEFEKDPQGNQVAFFERSNWQEALSQNTDDKNDILFEKTLLSQLRN
ncbi:hypothetical protein [Fictibacillus sp. 18YEL24]|uniref:hypothetical protein n=1 Tax=Fictibacillus sp. 18YEL24 TaxID=2745875 RepID=UPI0018CEBFD8|nr:hypothetical protein [Fictibacillus sp. 18YEL24]MBH0171675.1 hypothetical protein [Fictibacillus sp. 18YEL24]